jgi:uncharacterized protein YfaS (alpha-2-macroglobulin family)
MLQRLRHAWLSVALILAIAVLALAASGARAEDRKITLMPGMDLPGFDYSVIKGTTLDACQTACGSDDLCRAFTFNSKAKWCFLKSDVATPAAFAAATSGTVDRGASLADIAKLRTGELPFQADDLISTAATLAGALPKTDAPPPGSKFADLVKAGDAAVAKQDPATAAIAYRQALSIVGDRATWLKLAKLTLAHADAKLKPAPKAAASDGSSDGSPADDSSDSSGVADVSDLANLAVSASINAYLLSQSVPDRAVAMAALAQGLELKQMWHESIATYRAAIELAPNNALTATLDKVVAAHGFRITSNAVDAEAASPQICAGFSDPLATGDLSSYVAVEDAPQVSVDVQQAQICVTGVQHGRRYHVTFRAGLPSAEGEKLRKDVDINLFVPDRAPFVGFANNAYVLPSGLGGGLPISSVNAKTADVVIYRIGDRAIATAVRDGVFQGDLDSYSAESTANQYGQQVWKGQLDLAQGAPNANSVTSIPVADVLPNIQPGAYVVTASVANLPKPSDSGELATQWFIVTDLGLTTVSGDDGIHGFVRSLASAKPVAGAHVRLVAKNNEVLGEAVTDADGKVDFAPGLARGDGGRVPQLLVAETDGGDYAFLDVSKTAFDLTDRGVDGRASPGPLDLFATTERGVYRPGETVYLTALLRDPHAKAVVNIPLTLNLERPDGVVASTVVLKDQGAGSYDMSLPLIVGAMRGSWHIKLYADPKADPLSDTSFLVEDFEPDRLAFDIKAPDGPLKTDDKTAVDVSAKYLYGATAPGLAIEADAVISPTRQLDAFPGYTFGREDDNIEPDRESLGIVGTTDDDGNASAQVQLPQPQTTTRPLQAEVILSLVDTNGRTVTHSFTRPIMALANRIGIKPKFDADGGLPDGSDASFDIVAVSPDNKAVAETGLSWALSRVETNYQWYRDDGVWKWEAVTTNRKIANGTVDAVADGTVGVTGHVSSGQYQLEVDSSGDSPTSSTFQFYAGYYYPQAGSDTPDKLKVALDKPAYHAGDTAHLKLDPQFAGTALVMVVEDRIVSMQAVDVPASGTTVDLKVTDDWAPGAYVTAQLYRPSSATEKRMPARALGLAFASVDPGARKLGVSIETPTEPRPRQPFTAKLKLGNLVAGQKAYVAVSAVDVGILNLTNFKTPDPDGYFYGQRQLGVELRDLYGRLIDPTQGTPGTVRSGGDGAAGARLGTPPATSVLVAWHSGVVTVGADGTASVTFDLPDFNGSVRLNAIAWTEMAVGHASADAVVHDPVVVNLSPPRFLRIGDTSRLLVEINNVSGPAGTYKVNLAPGAGLTTDAPLTTFDLAAGARTSLDLGITGTAVGDQTLKLAVTAPSGDPLFKQLTLGVRASSAPVTTSKLVPIPAGGTVTLDTSYFGGMIPHSSELLLAIGPIARLDVPELLAELDRYPYGCAEQISSRALPLLYLNDVARMLGMGSDDQLKQRIKDSIANLMAKQTATGAFGLWGPSNDDADDLWLDAYVTEVLQRAKAAGYDVPAQALSRALDALGNGVSSAADFSNGGEDIAYALYDLARGGRAAIGDLRYNFESKLGDFGSPLAKAQLGAALALYGDQNRSAAAFAAAVSGLKAKDDRSRYRTDYGSQLRDTAAVLALASEFTPQGIDLAALAGRLADLRDVTKWTSTQDDAWTLVAAASLAKQAANGSVTIDGKAVTGSVYRRYDQEHFDKGPVTIVNSSSADTEMKVSVTGIPATPPPASGNGFQITREFFQPNGTKVNPVQDGAHQNDRFVVVLTVTASGLGSGQYAVADPLPGGFEIDNPDLGSNAGTGDLAWLKVDSPVHVESRTDQYVAAFRYTTSTPTFTTAYMVRATAPGTFVLPGATVEDMYRPELRANTDADTIKVTAPGK